MTRFLKGSAWIIFAGICLVLVGLVGCSVAPGYVTADRETYEAIAPEYRGYVEGDPVLSQGQRDRRYALIDSWDARTTEGEDTGEEAEAE